MPYFSYNYLDLTIRTRERFDSQTSLLACCSIHLVKPFFQLAILNSRNDKLDTQLTIQHQINVAWKSWVNIEIMLIWRQKGNKICGRTFKIAKLLYQRWNSAAQHWYNNFFNVAQRRFNVVSMLTLTQHCLNVVSAPF